MLCFQGKQKALARSSIRASAATTSHAAFSEPDSNEGDTDRDDREGRDTDSDSESDGSAVSPKGRGAEARGAAKRSNPHQGTIPVRARLITKKVAASGIPGIYEKASKKCAPIL